MSRWNNSDFAVTMTFHHDIFMTFQRIPFNLNINFTFKFKFTSACLSFITISHYHSSLPRCLLVVRYLLVNNDVRKFEKINMRRKQAVFIAKCFTCKIKKYAKY